MANNIPLPSLPAPAMEWAREITKRLELAEATTEVTSARVDATHQMVGEVAAVAAATQTAVDVIATTTDLEPAVVEGVVATPTSYWNTDGAAVGSVNLSWEAVEFSQTLQPLVVEFDNAEVLDDNTGDAFAVGTEEGIVEGEEPVDDSPLPDAVADQPITILRYEVWGRKTYIAPDIPDADPSEDPVDDTSMPIATDSLLDDEPEFLRLTTSQTTTATVLGLEMNTDYTFIVRAIAVNEIPGPFCDEVYVTTPASLPVMAAPTTPIVTSALGVVTVEWDGLMSDGTRPVQFSGVFAQVSDSETGTYTSAGQNLLTAGKSVIPDLVKGNTYWVHLVGIDRLNQTTAPSPAVAVTVVGVDLGNLEADITEAIQRAEDAGVAGQDAAAAAQTAADSADAKAAQALLDASNAASAASDAQTSANDALTAAQQAADDAETASGLVASKGRTWIQSTQPTGSATDLWIDTTNGANTPKKWDTATSQWVAVTDKAATDAASAAVLAKNAADTAQSTADTAKTNAATAQARADSAFTNAATAQGTANTALTTANGKNKVIFSTSAASGTTGYTAGDVWFQKSGSVIVGQWEFTTSWQSRTIDNAVIANLNAAKITSGIIDADRIGANTISIGKLDAGVSSIITASDGAAVNPYFADWTGTTPNGFTSWSGTVPVKETTITRTAGQAVRFNVPNTTVQAGLDMSDVTSIANPDYLTVSLDVYLVSGTFGQAGVIIDWGGMTNNRVILNLSDEIPSPQVGKWYRVSKVLARPANATGTFTAIQGYLMGQWTGMSGGAAVKEIIYDSFNFRASTAEEIAARSANSYTELWRTPDQTTIDGGKITAKTVAASTMIAGTITAASGILADAVITNAKIADLAVNNAKINDISGGKITARTITADKIGADQITANEIKAGTITSSEINVGSLTAAIVTSTSVSGVTITGTTIQSSSAANTGVKLTTAGLFGYGGGSQMFKLDAATGVLTASGVNISGAITATSGTFTGTVNANAGTFSGSINVTGTLTGGTLRTAGSGKRVEMGANAVKFYGTDGTYPITLQGTSGTETNGGAMQITTGGGVSITVGRDSSDTHLDMGVGGIRAPRVIASAGLTLSGGAEGSGYASLSLLSGGKSVFYGNVQANSFTNLDDTGWVSLTYASGFATQGDIPVQFRRIGNQVYTRGLVTRTGGFAAGTIYTIGTFPTSFAPTAGWLYYASVGSSYAANVMVTILDTGSVRVQSDTAITWAGTNLPVYNLN